MFLPGAILVLLGFSALIAPRLILAVLAICLVTLGIVFCSLAWKFLRFKKTLDRALRQVEGRIVVTSSRQKPLTAAKDIYFDDKKIILH